MFICLLSSLSVFFIYFQDLSSFPRLFFLFLFSLPFFSFPDSSLFASVSCLNSLPSCSLFIFIFSSSLSDPLVSSPPSLSLFPHFFNYFLLLSVFPFHRFFTILLLCLSFGRSLSIFFPVFFLLSIFLLFFLFPFSLCFVFLPSYSFFLPQSLHSLLNFFHNPLKKTGKEEERKSKEK